MTTTNAVRFVIECGKGIQFEVTNEMLIQLGQHQNSFDHVLMIGLKNIVGDSHAGVKREDFATEDEWKAASKAKAELKLAAILNGDLRAQSTTRAPKLSDEAAFIRSFTIAAIKSAFVAKHGKDSWKEKTDGDAGAAFIAGLLEKHGARFEPDAKNAWLAELAKRVAAKTLADSIDFDI